jgi:hypothetical protein
MQHYGGGKSSERDIPKTGALNRLKNAPKDQIPISKAPRRQKSSRFYVTEKVQLERTSAFEGKAMIRFSTLTDSLLSLWGTGVVYRCASSITPRSLYTKDSTMYGGI